MKVNFWVKEVSNESPESTLNPPLDRRNGERDANLLLICVA